jgi:ribosomal-protein-alanine N-acetyltransferase
MSAILKEPALEFRPMQEVDLHEVLEIERASYPYPWTRTIFQDCLHAGYSCWVCGRRGIIEGYGILSVAAGESHLLNICIREESRRQGLGARLLTHLTAIARRHEAEVLFLEVRVSNTTARRLYEFSGFNELGVRRNYYPTDKGQREDALIFARTL